MLNPKYNILAECNFRNAEEVQAIGQAFGAVTYNSDGINFNGSFQYVELQPANWGGLNSAYTIIIRFKTQASGVVNRGLIYLGDFNSSQGEMAVLQNNSELLIRTNSGISRVVWTGMVPNTEYEIAISINGSSLKFYVNGGGELDGGVLLYSPLSGDKLIIGGYYNSGFTWLGSVKYVAVIDQPLTAAEVADFYARTTFPEVNLANWESVLLCNTRNYALGTTNNDGTGTDATLGTGTPSTFPTLNERGKGLTCLSASGQFINTQQQIAIGEPFTLTFAFEGGDAQTLSVMGSSDQAASFKGLRVLTFANQLICNVFIDASNYWAINTNDYSDGGLNMFTITYDGTRSATAFQMYDMKGVVSASGVTGTVASGEINSGRNILLNAVWNGSTPTGGVPTCNVRFFGIKKNWVATRTQVRAIHQQILQNL